MSFYEKSAWGSFVILALALIAYGAALLAGNFVAPAATAVVLLAVVSAVVAAEVAYHIAIGLSLLWTRDDGEADERDRVINWRAESASGPILAVAVVVVVGWLLFGELAGSGRHGMVAAHLLTAGLLAAEGFKCLRQILLYRRGFAT